MSLFGSSYARHGTVLLVLLVISAVPDAITNLYVSVLRVRDRLGVAAALNLSLAAMAAACAWLLLPSLGVAGAGAGWLIAQTAGALFVLADVVRNRQDVSDLTIAHAPAVPGSLAASLPNADAAR